MVNAAEAAHGAEKRTKTIRTENPILLPLGLDAAAFQRFGEAVNGFARKLGGVPVPQPILNDVRMSDGSVRHFVVLDLATSENFQELIVNIRGFIHDSYLNSQLPEATFTDGKFLGLGGEEGYCISKTLQRVQNPDQNSGFVLKKNKIELRYNTVEAPSEVEFAYEVIIASLMASGEIDMSTPVNRAKTLHTRRELFMRIYHDMLVDFMPVASRDDIYGLDEQIEEIETNLFAPLDKEMGFPMNTLLVGAPGVGKSLVSRFFVGHEDVMTVPLPISNLKGGFFEGVVLPKLSRIKNSLKLPIVVYLDDVEILLESGISVDEEGRSTQAINPQDRSRALNLLERMEDTYGIYLICTLNHPDVEAAFLRRFHPIYFPLPSVDQRRHMLTGILPHGHLDAETYKAAIEDVVGKTDGFNYNSIALIPRYIRNAEIKKPKYFSQQDYLETIERALQAARARASINKLAEFDRKAREMVGMGDKGV